MIPRVHLVCHSRYLQAHGPITFPMLNEVGISFFSSSWSSDVLRLFSLDRRLLYNWIVGYQSYWNENAVLVSIISKFFTLFPMLSSPATVMMQPRSGSAYQLSYMFG